MIFESVQVRDKFSSKTTIEYPAHVVADVVGVFEYPDWICRHSEEDIWEEWWPGSLQEAWSCILPI